MIELKFFTDVHEARTLPIDVLNENSSGWIFKAEIQEDYYKWINYFEAEHPIYGNVWGDYEYIVSAHSLESLMHFLSNHPPQNWDYQDI